MINKKIQALIYHIKIFHDYSASKKLKKPKNTEINSNIYKF